MSRLNRILLLLLLLAAACSNGTERPPSGDDAGWDGGEDVDGGRSDAALVLGYAEMQTLQLLEVAGSAVAAGGFSWRRFEATLEGELLGQGTFAALGRGAGSYFLTGPTLVEGELPASAKEPPRELGRVLVEKRLFGTSPVENRFYSPAFDIRSARNSWYPATSSTLVRHDLPLAPSDLPALEVNGSAGALVRGGSGPLSISIWVGGRGEFTASAPQVAIIGFFAPYVEATPGRQALRQSGLRPPTAEELELVELGRPQWAPLAPVQPRQPPAR